jgi:hypothetical protein
MAIKEKGKIVEESVKTRKAREKLKKRIDAFEKKLTPQALEKKTAEIHRWIAVNAIHRVVLHNKAISLFDENQNSVAVSRKVEAIAEQIRAEVLLDYKSREAKEGTQVLKKLVGMQSEVLK